MTILKEDGAPVTTTDNAGEGLTKPERPIRNSYNKIKEIIRRKKNETPKQN